MGGALWPGTEPVKQLTILVGTLSARCSRAVEGKEREGEGERARGTACLKLTVTMSNN